MFKCRLPQLNSRRWFLLAAILASGIYPPAPAIAEVSLGCVVSEQGEDFNNQAIASYRLDDAGESITTISNATGSTVSLQNTTVDVVAQGLTDSEGNSIYGFGQQVNALSEALVELGLTPEQAQPGSLAGVQMFTSLAEDLPTASTDSISLKVKLVIAAAVPEQKQRILQAADSSILPALIGTAQSTLVSLGLKPEEAEAGDTAAQAELENLNLPFEQAMVEVNRAAITAVPTQAESINQNIQNLSTALQNRRNGQETTTGDIQFHFQLRNQGRAAAQVALPLAEEMQASLSGPGTIVGVEYTAVDAEGDKTINVTAPTTVTLPAGQAGNLLVKVQLPRSPQATSVTVSLGSDCGTPAQQSLAILPPVDPSLIDPLGQITGCRGETLADYRGFSVALYEPDPSDPTGGVRELTELTLTEVPDRPDNDIPLGLNPNTENSNPFFLTNSDEGRYSFLFDEGRGQLEPGQTYILLINSPENSVYSQRRLRLEIGDRNGNLVQYTATSLDGKSISATGGQTAITGAILLVEDAERIGLSLAVLDLDTGVCEAQELRITKTGDRAAAAPGDTALYRLSIKNLANTSIANLVVTDVLPQGFRFVDEGTKAAIGDEAVAIEASREGRNLSFTVPGQLETGQVLTVVYAAQLTPDALRGDGENSAIVNGQRLDTGAIVRDGPAVHRLRVRAGILSDAGTIIGRVFVDKNFDGEQQPGEPGVPDAVIFLEDGNRITTDAEGMFSVANVLPGYHTGVLDLTSVPGYTVAPNLRWREGNSQSRLVQLAPGGMVRMNFAVTPTSEEEQ